MGYSFTSLSKPLPYQIARPDKPGAYRGVLFFYSSYTLVQPQVEVLPICEDMEGQSHS